MATEYQVWLASPFGVRSSVLDLGKVTKLTYVRNVNAVGSLVIECAREAVPSSWMAEDARIEVWRRPDGGAWTLEGEGPWLLSAATKGVSKDSAAYWKLTAEPMMTVLQRRNVLYYANTASLSVMTFPAEQMLKTVFYYNFYDSALSPFATVGGVGGRNLSAYISYQVVQFLGPSITKQFAWRTVLPVMQEIAKQSFGLGTPMYFDVVWRGSAFEFQVYLGQRGADRSTGASQLVVSVERGTLGGTVESTIDWSNSASVVLAGGSGQDAQRKVAGVADGQAVARSPFGRREVWLDRTQLDLLTSLASEATSELRSRRPKQVLSGDVLSAPGAIYGLDWGFGDKLIGEFEGKSYVARLDSTTVTLDGGKETVKAALRGELS